MFYNRYIFILVYLVWVKLTHKETWDLREVKDRDGTYSYSYSYVDVPFAFAWVKTSTKLTPLDITN